MGTAIAAHYVKYYADFYKFDQITTIWLISSAVCDATIALSLTWYLVSLSSTYVGKTIHLIRTLYRNDTKLE